MVSLVRVCALSFVGGRVFRVEKTFAIVFLNVSGRVWRIAKRLDCAEQKLEFGVHVAQFVAKQHQFLNGIFATVATCAACVEWSARVHVETQPLATTR